MIKHYVVYHTKKKMYVSNYYDSRTKCDINYTRDINKAEIYDYIPDDLEPDEVAQKVKIVKVKRKK